MAYRGGATWRHDAGWEEEINGADTEATKFDEFVGSRCCVGLGGKVGGEGGEDGKVLELG